MKLKYSYTLAEEANFIMVEEIVKMPPVVRGPVQLITSFGDSHRDSFRGIRL
jgi:hypothetical protein